MSVSSFLKILIFHFGNGIYANANLTLVDDGHIYVGDKVMFGPNVIITTASHPVEPGLRARGLQYNKDVRIGENAWIGAGAILLPGICIGKNTVIGAGSVVTHDILQAILVGRHMQAGFIDVGRKVRH